MKVWANPAPGSRGQRLVFDSQVWHTPPPSPGGDSPWGFPYDKEGFYTNRSRAAAETDNNMLRLWKEGWYAKRGDYLRYAPPTTTYSSDKSDKDVTERLCGIRQTFPKNCWQTRTIEYDFLSSFSGAYVTSILHRMHFSIFHTKSSNNSSRSKWSGKECRIRTDYKPRLFFQLSLAREAVSRLNGSLGPGMPAWNSLTASVE